MISKFSATIAFLVVSATALQAGLTPAYYDAPFASASAVKGKLSKAGFKVLATYHPAGKKNLSVFVITNSKLKSMASKKTRGFAAIQRVMVDSSKKTVRATNPTYWMKAFMQKKFNAGTAKSVTASLKSALGKLSGVKDGLSSGDISGFHFMMGMPYYEDMIDLGKKSGVKAGKKVFELKLANGIKLMGVKLPKGVEGFINKVGTNKALALPYTILIEKGHAYALHARYYLAVSYPLLSMGQFMKISSTPDAIELQLKKALK